MSVGKDLDRKSVCGKFIVGRYFFNAYRKLHEYNEL